MAEHATPATESAPPGDTHIVHPGDRTVLMGRVFPIPVYTFVFATLGVITLVELALAEWIPRGFLSVPLLLVLSIAKAALVVWFYMHLNTDSRIFAITLALPVIMVTLATLFLAIVPTGY